jgi:hypothetical protein
MRGIQDSDRALERLWPPRTRSRFCALGNVDTPCRVGGMAGWQVRAALRSHLPLTAAYCYARTPPSTRRVQTSGATFGSRMSPLACTDWRADAPGYEVRWIELSRSANETSPIDLDTNRCAELLVSFNQRAP